LISAYFGEIHKLLEKVEKKERQTLQKAAKKVAETIQQGGIIHLFGCGHSHILTEEVYYRAGGLVPIHPILHEPLMLHEGAIQSSKLEKKNDYAETFMKDQDIQESDLVFVISTSGRNPVPIDVARIAKEKKKAYTIGITSIEYSTSERSRHKSGKYLFEVVDTIINNHAPIGDSLLSHEKVQVNFSPSSTTIGSAILNGVFAEAIVIMAESGFQPPVLLSGNMEGSEVHNTEIINKYKDRIQL
jgi:uncharacterized phosphosugar-binding protein